MGDNDIVGKTRKEVLRGFLMKELVWSQAWPMQVGRFWFYGCRHYLDEAALHLVEVGYGEAGWRYTINGEFMRYEASGLWQEVVLPELPVKREKVL